MSTGYQIVSLAPAEAEDVLRIYGEGIATGNSTFGVQAPSWSKWDEGHLRSPRLVAKQATRLLGWAALSPVSARCVYSGVAEVSIYVAAEARGRGVGRTLLRALIDASEKQGIWTLQAGIFQRTRPAWRWSRAADSAWSASGSAWAKWHSGPWQEPGGTSSFSSGEARW